MATVRIFGVVSNKFIVTRVFTSGNCAYEATVNCTIINLELVLASRRLKKCMMLKFFLDLFFLRPLGRPRCRWEDNIKMDLREIGINGANWIRLAQDRVQSDGTQCP
jgi:hypothetical protein